MGHWYRRYRRYTPRVGRRALLCSEAEGQHRNYIIYYPQFLRNSHFHYFFPDFNIFRDFHSSAHDFAADPRALRTRSCAYTIEGPTTRRLWKEQNDQRLWNQPLR